MYIRLAPAKIVLVKSSTCRIYSFHDEQSIVRFSILFSFDP